MDEPASMTGPAWLDELFAAIDRRDATAFVGFLTEDASFTFGNAPAISGRARIAEAVAGFFDAIAGVSHKLSHRIFTPSHLMCCGEVTYERSDGSSVTLPFANAFALKDDRICDYQIYVDLGPLWNPVPD